jgi:hypothetical protein
VGSEEGHMCEGTSCSYMYVGCSGFNRVCTHVAVGTIVYVCGLD